MSEEKRRYQREYMREHRKLQRVQEYEKQYRQSEARRKNLRRYEESDKAKIVRQRRKESGRKSISDYKYRHSKNGAETIRLNYLRLKNWLIELLGGKCALCDNSVDLKLDHIHGDGKYWRHIFGNNIHEWYYYKRHPEIPKIILQVLCKECHKIKTANEARARLSEKYRAYGIYH